ncbi:MAG: 2-oxoacid:acceptor oxidoreductase subunit alpha [Bacillota bacterium]
MSNYELIQGNEACALGALRAKVQFCAGYPITPSSEIMEILSGKIYENNGRSIQMEDEIASMGAVIGASVMGKKAITITSGPGFDLKQENIGFASMAEIPCVIVDVQRSGPSTGGATKPGQGDIMQSRYGTSGDTLKIVLYPNSVEEIYLMTIQAFNYSEKYMTPVVLLMDETIGHMRESVNLEKFNNVEIIDRRMTEHSVEEYLPYQPDGDGIVSLVPFGNEEGYRYVISGMHHNAKGMPDLKPNNIENTVNRINKKIEMHQDEIFLSEDYYCEDAEYLIVACGSVSRSAKEAVKKLRAEGIKTGLYRPITIWPFDYTKVSKLGKQVKGILVPEMNNGQLVHSVIEAVGLQTTIKRLNVVDGSIIKPEQIVEAIKEVQLCI